MFIVVIFDHFYVFGVFVTNASSFAMKRILQISYKRRLHLRMSCILQTANGYLNLFDSTYYSYQLHFAAPKCQRILYSLLLQEENSFKTL